MSLRKALAGFVACGGLLITGGAAVDRAGHAGLAQGAIAFLRDDDRLYLMRPDGTRERRLHTPNYAGPPVWSPSGQRIAFGAGERSRLYVANADGSKRRAVTPTPGGWMDNFYSAWSPNGRRIAYERDNDGEHILFAVNSDGTEWRRLTNGPRDFCPAWSPDGVKIVFTREQSEPTGLLVKNINGGTRRIVLPDRASAETVLPHCVVWSHSGAIFFIGRTSRGSEPHVLRISADGSQLTDLTPDRLYVKYFALSPDQRLMAFSAQVGSRSSDIYIMSRDGSGVRKLTDSPAKDEDPTWSPAGRQIAFISNRDRNDEIYVMNRDGSGQRNLTRSKSDESDPAWRPAS